MKLISKKMVNDFETFQPMIDLHVQIPIEAITDYGALLTEKDLIYILGKELFDIIIEKPDESN